MAFEDTNKWAAYFTAQKTKDAAKRQKATQAAKETRDYMLHKPAAIVAFEREIAQRNGRPTSYDDRTANGLTRFIIDWLQWHNCYAARINIGGVKVDGDRWRTSGSTKGVADVIACIGGLFVQFEVKAGRDKPREAQLIQQELTRQAGGEYFFTHNADEFLQQVETIKRRICNN